MVIKNLFIRISILFVFVTILSSVFSIAHAEGTGGKAGIHFGYLVPDADDTVPREVMGITGSAMLLPTVSFGGYYFLSDHQTTSGGRDFTMSIHGLVMNYHMAGGSGDTYFGIKGGVSKIKTTENNTDLIFSPYHWGITAGYDYALFSRLLVGYEGSYLSYRKSSTTQGGAQYEEPAFKTISFGLNLKFLF